MKTLLILPFIGLLFSSCGKPYGKVSFEESPQVLNVSAYDPKKIQRSGSNYSPLNQASLKQNGAKAQIARCSKGFDLDPKCADFLVGADRQGMMLGAYHYVKPYGNIEAQADLFINRLKHIKRSRGIRANKIILVADIDTKCTVPQMIRFVERVKKLTGVYPMIYIENGELIRSRLRNATSRQKATLRKCPYWLALYSHSYPGIATPQALIHATRVWKTWALWQYGGVEWERGRSKAKHYNRGSWKTPRFFGNMSRPMERNGFNGKYGELVKFWNNNAWRW